MPVTTSFSNMNGWDNQHNGATPNGTILNGSNKVNVNGSFNGSLNGTMNGTLNGSATNGPPIPSEDKYAALKDLDNEFKTQNILDWNSTGSNGSLYSSPTPNGSVYSSPSPQSSMFGSPSQGKQNIQKFSCNNSSI